MSIIIWEGPDMTGKTNISKEFCRLTKLQYFKNQSERASFDDDPDYFRNCLKFGVPYQLSLLEQVDCNISFDRHYPTEWVYSMVFARETYPEILRQVDERFAALDALIVICYRDNYDNVCDDTFPERINGEALADLDAGYRKFAAWTKCSVKMLNVTERNLELQIGEVCDFTRRMWDL